MAIAFAYLGLSLLFFLMGFRVGALYFALFFYWVALSFALVGLAYLVRRPGVFRKRRNGKIPLYLRWAFVPYLLMTELYNGWARHRDPLPSIQQIDEQLYLACRLFPSDIETLKHLHIDAVLDVTGEFDGLDWSLVGARLAYRNIPVLAHTRPSERQLKKAIRWLRGQLEKGNRVVVHCALGRSRSVLVLAAYLLSRDEKTSLDALLNQITHSRPIELISETDRAQLESWQLSGWLSDIAEEEISVS